MEVGPLQRALRRTVPRGAVGQGRPRIPAQENHRPRKDSNPREVQNELCPAEPWGWAIQSYGRGSPFPIVGLKVLDLLETLCFFLCLPFGVGILILCRTHHCVLEAHNLFDFPGSQLESSLPWGMNLS